MQDLQLSTEESRSKNTTFGAAASLLIVLGYLGGLIIELILVGDFGTRLQYRAFAIVPFLYIVFDFLIGRAGAFQMETERSCRT